jgi:hypothetical protein
MAAFRQHEAEEKNHYESLKATDHVLRERNCNMNDVPNLLMQNMQMGEFIKSKGFVDENGNIKV